MDERARIHRVAHHCVRSARDDACPSAMLMVADVKVFSIDAGNQQEPEDKENVAGDDDGDRHAGPFVPEVQGGNDDEPEEAG